MIPQTRIALGSAANDIEHNAIGGKNSKQRVIGCANHLVCHASSLDDVFQSKIQVFKLKIEKNIKIFPS